MIAYDRGMRELLEECRSSAFDAKEYSLCDRIDAALRTPVPPIFDAFCTALEQRDEARAEVERLKALGALQSADIQRLTSLVAQGEADWAALRAEAATAYRRGAEAMREAAAIKLACYFPKINTTGRCGRCTLCEYDMTTEIRAVPIPEDKP